jgi:hypothetical protein
MMNRIESTSSNGETESTQQDESRILSLARQILIHDIG